MRTLRNILSGVQYRLKLEQQMRYWETFDRIWSENFHAWS